MSGPESIKGPAVADGASGNGAFSQESQAQHTPGIPTVQLTLLELQTIMTGYSFKRDASMLCWGNRDGILKFFCTPEQFQRRFRNVKFLAPDGDPDWVRWWMHYVLCDPDRYREVVGQ